MYRRRRTQVFQTSLCQIFPKIATNLVPKLSLSEGENSKYISDIALSTHVRSGLDSAPVLSVYLDRAWLGLRFIRAVILYNMSDVLVYIRVINSSQAIRFVQLFCTFVCLVSSHSRAGPGC